MATTARTLVAVAAAAAAAFVLTPSYASAAAVAAGEQPNVGANIFLVTLQKASVGMGDSVHVSWGCVGCIGAMVRVWAVPAGGSGGPITLVNSTGLGTGYTWTPSADVVDVGVTYAIRVNIDSGSGATSETSVTITPASPTGSVQVGNVGLLPATVSLAVANTSLNLTFACTGDVTSVDVGVWNGTAAAVTVGTGLSCAAAMPFYLPLVPAMYLPVAPAAGGMQLVLTATNGNPVEYALTFPVAVLPPFTVTMAPPLGPYVPGGPILNLTEGAPVNITWVLDAPAAPGMGLVLQPGCFGWPKSYNVDAYYPDTNQLAFSMAINWPTTCAALPCATSFLTSVPQPFPFSSLYYFRASAHPYGSVTFGRTVTLDLASTVYPSWSPSPSPAPGDRAGTIAGATIGSLAAAGLAAAACMVYRRRRRASSSTSNAVPFTAAAAAAAPATYQTDGYTKL